MRRRSDVTLSRLRLGAMSALMAFTTMASRAVASPVAERIALHVDGGAGTMITPQLRDRGGYDIAISAAGRVGVRVLGPLEVHAGVAGWLFPSRRGDGSIVDFFGGFGIDVPVARIARLAIGASAGLALSDRMPHAMLDANAAVEFNASRWLSIGPSVRIGHAFSRAPEAPIDATFWSAGVSMSLRIPPPLAPTPVVAPRPIDRDHDGVADSSDRCVNTRAGEHPDPERPGCPDDDTDRDGVVDHLDACRAEPIGAHPDPVWRGCPLPDDDADGVPNQSDACPLQPPGALQDRAWLGCPARDADHDGVPDDDDLCTQQARGDHPDPDHAGCPDGDVDHDGVTDHTDDCPREAIGLHMDASRRGCPDRDADRDGVPDSLDHCPSVAGAISADPTRNGCGGDVVLRDAQIVTRAAITFARGGAALRGSSNAALAAVASLLQRASDIRRVAIRVRVDATTGESSAPALRALRAAAVRFWLVSHGVDAGRVVVDDSALLPTVGARGDVDLRVVDPAIGAP